MTQNFKFISVQVFCVFFACCVVFGADRTEAAELSEPWTNVRALGMGNAYTAIVRDADALFYNPAGLARNTSFSWTILNPRLGANGLEAVENAQLLASIGNDPAGALSQLYGSKIWLGGGAKSAILVPNFALAVYANTDLGLTVTNPAATTMNLNYYFDYGVAMGGGFGLIPNIFSFGLTLRQIDRTGTTLPLGPATLASLDPATIEGELKRRGTGYGANLGAVLTLPGPAKPSFSVVYKNAGVTSFSHKEGTGAPPSLRPELIVGAALEIEAPLVSLRSVIDYKHADRNDVQIGRKIHLGVELEMPLIDIRAGLHQGYWTAGVGMGLGLLSIDAASYGVELGEYPGQHEDRRYLVQITFDLGIDPGSFGFGGSSKSGERRRLKQRR